MSNFAQAAAFIVVGGVVGAVGFSVVTPAGQVANAAPPVAELPSPLIEPMDEAPEAAPEVLTVSYAATGSVERDATNAAFAIITVESSVDVGDVMLNLSGASGARVDEAVGVEWTKRGASLAVNIGEMHANEERSVIVALTLRGDSGRFKMHTEYRDLHTGKMENVVSSTQGHSISRKMQEPEVYEAVRLAYTEQALEAADRLIAQKDYAEALTWVDDAYLRNVEVGMTMRLQGSLSNAQTRLSAMQDELKELSRPKPKAKRAPKKGPVIDWVFGDAPSPSRS